MEELEPQELEELVQELEEESSAEELLPPEVEQLLRDLQSERGYSFQLRAAKQLGEVSRSNRRVVQTLITAAETDASVAVRTRAAKALRTRVHQAVLQQHPDLKEAAEKLLEQTPGSEMVTRPAHLQVETEGDTLDISWKPEVEQRKDAVKSPLWVLLVSALLLLMAISMSPGQLRLVWILVLSVVTLGSGYWIAAVWTNTTKLGAGKEEWILQRGPLPIPKGQFYIRPIRLDPAACKWVWTDRVEQYKLRWRPGGSGGSADGPLGCLFALVEIGVFLSSIRRELVVTHTLYARCVDGSDQELLYQLSKREAEYVGHALQNLLDAEGGPQAEE